MMNLKLLKFLIVPVLWSILCINPVFIQAQEPQKPVKQLSDTVNVLPADTVLAGQKKPFTDAQRLEAANQRFLKRAVIPSVALIGAGILTIQERGLISSIDVRNARNKVLPNYATNADDFLMIVPLAGLYGFNIISSQNRHELGRQTILLFASGALASAIVWPTKKLTDIDRPNNHPYAFPSGHTAYAFTIATFMDKEFRHKSPWISFASYGIAGATGVLRVLNNAHWLADVLAGAGVGILSVNTVYWIHAKLTSGGGLNTAVRPILLPTGQPGVGMTVQF